MSVINRVAGERLGRRISIVLAFSALLAVAGLSCVKPNVAHAQQGLQGMIQALKQSLARNQAALRKYTWTETTQISFKGKVKKWEQMQCRYGPDGTLQKTLIQQQAEERRHMGPLRKAIMEQKKEEMQGYIERATQLARDYVPPDPQRIQAAETAGNVFLQPQSAEGLGGVTMKNYLLPGDTISLGFDLKEKKIRSYIVQSYLDDPKDAITLTINFASLPDGTSYPQQTMLYAPTKEIQVSVFNSGYEKTVP